MTLRMRSAGLATAVTRSFLLGDCDIQRVKTGDGRIVRAYAAVFDTPTEIHDQDGHYQERIAPAAFNRTISHRGTAFGVFYNHGRTLYGTPSDRAAVPLGTPLEVRADNRGVITETRYNKTKLADDILEAIDNGDIRGQSFTGRMRKSSPERGPYRARGGELTVVTRQEIELIEYGPTPFPAYDDAAIVGRRSAGPAEPDSLMRLILSSDDAVTQLVTILGSDPVRDSARQVLSDLVAMNETASEDESQSDADRATFLTRLRSLAEQLTSESGTSDPDRASADTPPVGHSAPKLTPVQVRNRARLYEKGLI